MKIKLTVVALLFISSLAFGWGHQSHVRITDLALKNLAAESPGLWKNHEKISLMAARVDGVKDYRSDEAARHFLDFENYPELAVGLPSESDFERLHDLNFIDRNGNLPYAIEEEYSLLVKSIRSKDFRSAVDNLAFLSHYCEDLYQPLHLTREYDGRGRQHGLHSKFESAFADELWPDVEKMKPEPQILISNLHQTLYEIIKKNRTYLEDIFQSEGKPRRVNDFGRQDRKLREISEGLLQDAIGFVSSMIMTACREAGAGFPDTLECSSGL
ncbi:MAG: hypothetical protein PHW04_12135 [Candidatus Wallbacteria bacterium]|nr:hypothetical protein [Candidatus Wallbacteria bacterium]